MTRRCRGGRNCGGGCGGVPVADRCLKRALGARPGHVRSLGPGRPLPPGRPPLVFYLAHPHLAPADGLRTVLVEDQLNVNATQQKQFWVSAAWQELAGGVAHVFQSGGAARPG